MKGKGKDTVRIFVSYASEDRKTARNFIAYLSKIPKVEIFGDNQFSAGENWRSKLKKQLSQSDYFFVLLSPGSIQSKWVQLELGAAWGLNKLIIPVVTDRDLINRLPIKFADLKIIDLDDLTPRPETINQIIETYEKTAA